jgi:hypothetical protein
MYNLSSKIVVGKYKFKVHEVRIKKSLHSYMDTAVIKIPTSARLKQSDGNVTESMPTAKYFAVGDKVVIDLGYDGNLKNEFTGFVSRINFTTPLEIECEGYGWQLRQKSFKGSFKSITVKELLEKLIVGTDIVLDKEMDKFEIPISNFTIPEQPILGILDYLKEHCMCSIFFKNNVLFCGLSYQKKGNTVKHTLGYNVIKDGNLKERKASEVNVQVNISSEKSDGTKAKISSGAAGGKVINKRTIVTDEAVLKVMADKKLATYSFDGYEGKITTFLIPYSEPLDESELKDNRYAERGGRYVIDAIELIYNRSGGRRICDLGIKIA